VLGGEISDGTVSIAGGQVLKTESIGDDSVNTTIATAPINNRIVTCSALAGTSDTETTEFTSAITGHGTIHLAEPSGLFGGDFITATIDASVASGQHIAFMSGYHRLEFGSLAVAQAFAGTVTGLNTSDPIESAFTFDKPTIQSAGIVGAVIDIVFGSGDTTSLANSVDFAGALSFFNSSLRLGLKTRQKSSFSEEKEAKRLLFPAASLGGDLAGRSF
jgi:hypothetical protein